MYVCICASICVQNWDTSIHIQNIKKKNTRHTVDKGLSTLADSEFLGRGVGNCCLGLGCAFGIVIGGTGRMCLGGLLHIRIFLVRFTPPVRCVCVCVLLTCVSIRVWMCACVIVTDFARNFLRMNTYICAYINWHMHEMRAYLTQRHMRRRISNNSVTL
jgi:hypothetical protein